MFDDVEKKTRIKLGQVRIWGGLYEGDRPYVVAERKSKHTWYVVLLDTFESQTWNTDEMEYDEVIA